MKKLKKNIEGDLYIITKTPPEQYFSISHKIKELISINKPSVEFDNSVDVFDDVLGRKSTHGIYQFFMIKI